MKQLRQLNNPILEYNKLVLEIDHDRSKTPSNEEVIKKISEELKVSPELIKIKHIFSNYGSSKSKIIVNVYKNIEMLKKLEEIKKKPKAKKGKKQAQQKKE